MHPIIGVPPQIPCSVREGIYADCLMPVVETVRLLVEDPFQQGEASVSIFVIPAEAGIQLFRSGPLLPAFAGTSLTLRKQGQG